MARRGAEFWRGQLEGWHHSDLTQREYSAQQGGEREELLSVA